ncbi:MAG: hypothetical protein R3182_00530 [Draconibacterium sp.]|nr:hypothetical protein [Draconibacterium sp.]
MKTTKSFLLYFTLITLIQLPVFSYAQEADVQKIIQKSWKAMFGDLKNEDIKSIYVERYFHGSDVPDKVYVKRPNQFRNEARGNILVFDGKRAAWEKRTPDKDGNPQKPSLIEKEYWKHFEVDIAMVFPACFDYPSALEGKEKCGDGHAYKLFIQLPLGGHVTYYIDSKTFLITKYLVNWDGTSSDDDRENIIIGYTDYDGILYPDGISFQGHDGPDNGIYKNVKFNIKPNEGIFEIPKGL